MDELPADAMYVWVGLAAVSLVALAVAVSLPTDPPPDTDCVTATVDSVAASPHEATGVCPLDANRVRVRPHRIALAAADGTTHATVTNGPVTPTGTHGDLGAVLDGTPPERVFESPAALERAAAAARNGTGDWQTTSGSLRARRVSWGETDVTLVGV